jgi:hypothetical protein
MKRILLISLAGLGVGICMMALGTIIERGAKSESTSSISILGSFVILGSVALTLVGGFMVRDRRARKEVGEKADQQLHHIQTEHKYTNNGFCKHCGWERKFIEKTGRSCTGAPEMQVTAQVPNPTEPLKPSPKQKNEQVMPIRDDIVNLLTKYFKLPSTAISDDELMCMIFTFGDYPGDEIDAISELGRLIEQKYRIKLPHVLDASTIPDVVQLIEECRRYICPVCGRGYSEERIKLALIETNPVMGMFKNVVLGSVRWHCECGQINTIG